eukprot:scaffold108405_cov21-Tisochrysis_lutea.AAC.1
MSSASEGARSPCYSSCCRLLRCALLSRRFGRLDCQSILLSMPTPQISWSSTAIVAPMPTKCSSLRKKQAHGYYNEYPGTLLKECTQNVFCFAAHISQRSHISEHEQALRGATL